MGTLANSEDPDVIRKMRHFISACTVCYNKYNQLGLEYIIIWEFLHVIMNNPIRIVCICMGKIIRIQRVQWEKEKASMINVLKFLTLVSCQKGLDKQSRPRSDCFWRSSLIRVFPVCYSDMQFMKFNPDNQHLWLTHISQESFLWDISKQCRLMMKWKMKNTNHLPLKWKWTGRIDKSWKFH